MALPTSYMTGNYGKIPQYFETMLNAQAPEKFTVKFLKDLGFTSSTDTQFINVLKSLNFLDDSGIPTELYYQLYDRAVSKKLIAQEIQKSYSDLFALNMSAQNMTREELKGKFKVLTEGQKTGSTINQMVSTFIHLCEYAEWETAPTSTTASSHTETQNKNTLTENISESAKSQPSQQDNRGFDLNYDIHIHLPATRDQAVYDALFASLSKHIKLK